MDDQQPVVKPKNKKQKTTIKAPRRRKRGRFMNFLLFLGIIAAIGLFSWAEMQRRDAVSRLQETEQELEKIRESTQQSANEVAEQVLSSVRQLMDVPETPEPTVATIVDVNKLRDTSSFYDTAENGDHLIITENRAILYDPDRKIILDVVPVRINTGTDEEQPPADADQANENEDQEPITDPETGEVIKPSPQAGEPVPSGEEPLPGDETTGEPTVAPGL
jgi:hypothetical protein